MQRYLDEIETLGLYRTPTVAVAYDGIVDESVLARAFDLLCISYPLLRARIRHNSKGYLLYASRGHRPDFTVLSDEHALYHEISQPFDITSSVVKLMLVHDGTHGLVAMRATHAIIDGASWISMLEDLWRIYADLVCDVEVSINRGTSLPSPPMELLEGRWGGFSAMQNELSEMRSWDAERVSSSLERRGDIEKRLLLNQIQTSQLVSAARKNGTTVHGLICGACVLAQRTLDRRSRPVPMVCHSVVNLRDRVVPSVGRTEATSLFAVHASVSALSRNANPVTVGQEVKTQLDNAINVEELSILRNLPADPFLDPRLGVATVTNNGVIPEFTGTSDLSITDFVILFSRFYAKGSSDVSPIYGVSTYAGKLTVTLTCSSTGFTSEEAESLLDALRGQIKRCVCS